MIKPMVLNQNPIMSGFGEDVKQQMKGKALWLEQQRRSKIISQSRQ
jgi:hypothetical protein